MSTTKRDYYELLGVGRDADEGEIKRAFRRLARELHPDVSGAPDAERRFREVVEAYEVLSNGERRQLYDRFGHDGLRSGGCEPSTFDLGDLSDLFSAFFGDDLFGVAGRAGRGRARGADVAALVEIELTEAAHGTTRDVPFEVAVPCARCGGDGAEPGTAIVACPTCGGTGRLRQVSRSVFGEFVRTQTCPTCGGTGRSIEHPCADCNGAGRVLRGRGFPVLRGFGRGDLRVMVNVLVPRHLTPEQRRLLEEFERLSSEETYRADEGFFEKLKSAFR